MENQRLMLAALLSVVILMVWQVVFPPPPPVERGVETTELQESVGPSQAGSAAADPDVTSPTAATSDAVDGEDIVQGQEVSAAPLAQPEPEPFVPIVAATEESVVIDTETFQATFTNKGAQLTSYRIKNHLDAAGEPLELVRNRGTDLYPFAFVFGDRGTRLNASLFTYEEQVEDGQQVLRFKHASEAGVAEKVFSWDDRGFMDVDIRLENDGWGVLLGPSLGNEKGRSGYTQYLDHAVGYLRAGDLETINAKDLDEDQVMPNGYFDWIALENNYFLVAAIPGAGFSDARVRPVLEREEIDPTRPRYLPVDTSSSEEGLEPEMLVILNAQDDELQFRSYFGAKEYRELSTLPFDLQKTVRWGDWLGVLVKPLYLILGWIHANVVANYGWAIMLVTLLIRLVFFPLTHKSQKSMTKMQQLNPKVQAIRTKYRPKMKDKQGRPNVEAQRQMNEEVMAVYKSAGVNPAAGCLPMLLQLPVFFAFYRLLTNSVELKGAEWLFWIKDLANADPYFVLPLLMGATSVMVQKMTPAPPDPMQRRLMQMMPIMFTVFAVYMPSGLLVYWMSNNILSMGQQSLINRMKES
ncbi:MAG: membrane protein insertase YidC [Acidobacteriota bacterium]